MKDESEWFVQEEPSMTRLFVRDRSGARQVHIDRLITIGRSANNDIVLTAGHASRRHAWIWRQGEQVILEDLGSTHGTFVNGQRVIHPCFLKDNDVIQMGEAQLTLIAEQDFFSARTPPRGVLQMAAGSLFCTYCGAPNEIDASQCAECGCPLRLEQERQARMHNHPITPVEPVVARPFPAVTAALPARSDTRIWVLILSLAIVAVVLVTIVAALLVYLLS